MSSKAFTGSFISFKMHRFGPGNEWLVILHDNKHLCDSVLMCIYVFFCSANRYIVYIATQKRRNLRPHLALLRPPTLCLGLVQRQMSDRKSIHYQFQTLNMCLSFLRFKRHVLFWVEVPAESAFEHLLWLKTAAQAETLNLCISAYFCISYVNFIPKPISSYISIIIYVYELCRYFMLFHNIHVLLYGHANCLCFVAPWVEAQQPRGHCSHLHHLELTVRRPWKRRNTKAEMTNKGQPTKQVPKQYFQFVLVQYTIFVYICIFHRIWM